MLLLALCSRSLNEMKSHWSFALIPCSISSMFYPELGLEPGSSPGFGDSLGDHWGSLNSCRVLFEGKKEDILVALTGGTCTADKSTGNQVRLHKYFLGKLTQSVRERLQAIIASQNPVIFLLNSHEIELNDDLPPRENRREIQTTTRQGKVLLWSQRLPCSVPRKLG